MTSEKQPVTGIILAGGKNLRFGRVKTLEKLGGTTVFERVIDRLSPVVSNFVIVTAAGSNVLPSVVNSQIVHDIYPEAGPLGGIFTGLTFSQTSVSIIVASDMPFLSTPLLHHLLEVSNGFDAVIPRTRGGLIEPLHAVYSRSCLPVMKRLLDSRELGVRKVLDEVKVRYVEEEEYRRFDPLLLSIFNINRPADFEEAVKIAANEQKGALP